jgi:hypothetical protein
MKTLRGAIQRWPIDGHRQLHAPLDLLAFALAALGALLLIAGCATSVVQHAFSFNASDAPGVEIVDYRYGDSRQPGARADPQVVASAGRVRQSLNIIGEIRRPDSLYVRWRDLSTGKTYEDTVELARLLPKDIAKHRIHFTARGSQLFVYLITPYKRGPQDPDVGPRVYRDLKVITLAEESGREVETK